MKTNQSPEERAANLPTSALPGTKTDKAPKEPAVCRRTQSPHQHRLQKLQPQSEPPTVRLCTITICTACDSNQNQKAAAVFGPRKIAQLRRLDDLVAHDLCNLCKRTYGIWKAGDAGQCVSQRPRVRYVSSCDRIVKPSSEKCVVTRPGPEEEGVVGPASWGVMRYLYYERCNGKWKNALGETITL